IQNHDWTVSGVIGKMDNPFSLSNMLWDYDINPEGAALQLAYNLNDRHTLKANGAFIVLDEINQGVGAVPSIGGSHDPYVYGAQFLWESKWTPKIESSLGVAAFNIGARDSLSAKVQPFYNSGNSRDAATGLLKYNFNPIIGTGKVNGWFGGTNVRGHLVTASYSFTDYFNFAFTYYLDELIIGAPGQPSAAGHFMADLMWKF